MNSQPANQSNPVALCCSMRIRSAVKVSSQIIFEGISDLPEFLSGGKTRTLCPRMAYVATGRDGGWPTSGESVHNIRVCPTAGAQGELYPPSRRMSAKAPLQNSRPMYRNRRFIALWGVLVLFQWNLLASGFLCAMHQPMSGKGEEGTSGEMAIQMPHGSMVASQLSAVAAPGDASSCNLAGENTCRTNQLPGGSGCGAMSSCASPAALSPRAAFPSATGTSTVIALLVETPPTRSIRPEPRPPRA